MQLVLLHSLGVTLIAYIATRPADGELFLYGTLALLLLAATSAYLWTHPRVRTRDVGATLLAAALLTALGASLNPPLEGMSGMIYPFLALMPAGGLLLYPSALVLGRRRQRSRGD